MSNKLMIYDRMTDPLAAIKQIGNSIAMSKMFGCENVAQGEIFAMEVLARRTPALMLAERYNVIHGRLSMKSEAMLTGLLEMGGKHKKIRRTPDVAEIELTFGSETERFSLTWEEALQEPFVYNGKESEVIDQLASGKKPPIKPKYRTPRSRMQMLWARVVSDGVRVMCPAVVTGTYTPEEIDDFLEAPSNGHATKPATARAAPPASDDVVDAEYEVIDDEPSAEPVAAAVEPAAGGCSSTQSARVKELWGLLGATPEQRDKMLAKRGASGVRNLTAEQADELIAILEAKLPPVEHASESADQLAVRIKARLTQVEQTHPGTVAKVKAKLHSSGLAKISELAREHALSLLAAIDGTDLEAFLGISVWDASTPKN